MSSFNDSMGQSWSIEFDGLILDEVLTETGIDLADLSTGGLAKIEESVIDLVKVLWVLCRDQANDLKVDERTFKRRIVREVLVSAAEAIVGAAGNFFPAKQWSEMQLRLDQTRQFREATAALKPLMAMLDDPSLPPEIREGASLEIREQIASMMKSEQDNTTSDPSEADPSATGPDVTPPTLAPNVLENAGLVPGA